MFLLPHMFEELESLAAAPPPGMGLWRTVGALSLFSQMT
jgi:hypothetical protein